MGLSRKQIRPGGTNKRGAGRLRLLVRHLVLQAKPLTLLGMLLDAPALGSAWEAPSVENANQREGVGLPYKARLP
jgi:hypothetical protein